MRPSRKKSARDAFEALLEQEVYVLSMVHELRLKLAHFKKLNERNKTLEPSDIEIRKILNMLAEILYLLGFRRWNKPHYIEQNNNSSDSTQNIIDKLVPNDRKAKDMRKSYIAARNKWFSK